MCNWIPSLGGKFLLGRWAALESQLPAVSGSGLALREPLTAAASGLCSSSDPQNLMGCVWVGWGGGGCAGVVLRTHPRSSAHIAGAGGLSQHGQRPEAKL